MSVAAEQPVVDDATQRGSRAEGETAAKAPGARRGAGIVIRRGGAGQRKV